MLQRFNRLRTGWATLAVGALVASLLAVNATTATAVTDTPDERSRVNVCVGEALEDWGFTDVSDDHIFHDAINCLAHYGVTIGSGDGSTFTPDEPVNRWQMMLFLTRALVPTGINLRPGRGQNFTDLGNLNDEAGTPSTCWSPTASPRPHLAGRSSRTKTWTGPRWRCCWSACSTRPGRW